MPSPAIIPLAALAIASVTAVTMWVTARRFARRHIRRFGAAPTATWMFVRTIDPELEDYRRRALLLLPVLVVSLVVYLLRP